MDEAHCIAEWGHDFRPSYRALGAARYQLGRPPAVALTGSATPEVRQDIARALRFVPGRYEEHLGSFDRANLWFGVVRVRDERGRLDALVRLLAGDDRMVIVYAPTRSVTEAIARALVQAGHRAAPYHAGLTRERRDRTLEAFLDEVPIPASRILWRRPDLGPEPSELLLQKLPDIGRIIASIGRRSGMDYDETE